MTQDDSIEREVSSRLVEAIDLEVKAEALRAETSLRDDLGLDSLQSVNLVLELEHAFDVEIDDAEIEALETVGDVVRLVRQKKAR